MLNSSLVSLFVTLFLPSCKAPEVIRTNNLLSAAQATATIHRRGTQDVITTCKTKGTFALTFDDGPYLYENQISDYLTSRKIQGTFFVNGYNYDCIYDQKFVSQLQHTFKQGHLIGSHSWSHPNITRLSKAQFEHQLDLVETALIKILGIKPRYFRPPYGDINDQNIRVLKSRGYKIINWSFDSQDSIGATPQQSKAYYDKLAKSYPQPQIALNHETYQTTASQVIPHAIDVLTKAGYRLVSVSECLGLGNTQKDFYQVIGTPSPRDASWTCSGTPAPGLA
ncbi:hypothetical protein O181_043425 [Austropuccinia psidii MF-1]|uniref:NodB homology domain-containing protein n=1 Tax=Austropuccinia psidii MF-1 TaxID=1389203 RepID=A0A9Q3HJ58_9BASI|nr:hypothetical protein [Austropuccinia psidii MF-1]